MNRGLAYAEMYQFPKALTDFNQAVAIRQNLLLARRLHDENDLAEAFIDRGKTYSHMNRVKEALDDLHKALHITRTLLPERAFLIERYIEYVYSLLKRIFQSENSSNLLYSSERNHFFFYSCGH
jgi:tetratricopeptide (TPR) repeat protein